MTINDEGVGPEEIDKKNFEGPSSEKKRINERAFLGKKKRNFKRPFQGKNKIQRAFQRKKINSFSIFPPPLPDH